MPGWHAKTAELQEAGKLSLLGITQEQHADRSELFMKWQKMDWPVLVDSLNVLGVKAVPLSYLVDEYGIIRFRNPKEGDLKEFLKSEYAKPESMKVARLSDEDLRAVLKLTNASRVTEALSLNEKRMAKLKGKDLGRAQFQQGVLYRMRHDSEEKKEGDFLAAIEAWQKGLASDPSQYIWRRRIQQYGPRLDKPYSFYDWVTEAQADLVKRGERVLPLVAAISGAERARPLRGGKREKLLELKHPDPKGELPSDDGMVRVRPVVVQGTGKNNSALRVHLALGLDHEGGAHWNNESSPPMLWISENQAFEKAGPILYVSDEKKAQLLASSSEDRSLDFELRLKKGQKMPEAVTARLFYNVCQGAEGACLFLSQEITVPLK